MNAGQYQTAGSELTFDYLCPAGLSETFQYSVELPNLRILVPDPNDPVTTELVWTLR